MRSAHTSSPPRPPASPAHAPAGAPSTATRAAPATTAGSRVHVSVVREYRRARPDGSCDEYPFASTRQGGAGASHRQRPQGRTGHRGRSLRRLQHHRAGPEGDAYWVTVAP
ncbi:NucA/NucB deoxyribonuclease domain-containing protein [Solirubrobacter ginsenosidimutans]|uniref:NucA/NucB deoxyribonuclease domain-containing protein n=1 Tax=Solirubrobacter ginsenosidimutans TaxID=490573 RepID=UPI003FD8A6E8